MTRYFEEATAETYELLGEKNMNLLEGVCTEFENGPPQYGLTLLMRDRSILIINQARSYPFDNTITAPDRFTDDIADELKNASHFAAACYTDGTSFLFVWGIRKK